MIEFVPPVDKPSIIKVIGVGGGGSNAVNHMYRNGIKGVEFVVCNTDEQALATSPVPCKIQLGKSLTDGRGAGSIPEVGRNSALESLEDIKKVLSQNTRMLFITAGMGGGTGTGAAPIIAKVAREMNILTVAIVTMPFSFEGRKRRAQAEDGINELKKYVDTLLVISNDKLREIHGNLKIGEAFAQADNILAVAAKSIAEIISETLHINVDFADVHTVMKDSGVAIMGSATAEGNNRAIQAVETALHSPLLNDNNIEGARYILLNINSGKEEITMDEMGVINEYVQNKAGQTADIILGMGYDESLNDKISVTIIATGFKTASERDNNAAEQQRVIYELTDPHSAGKGMPSVSKNPLEPVLKSMSEPATSETSPHSSAFNRVSEEKKEETIIFSLDPASSDAGNDPFSDSSEPFVQTETSTETSRKEAPGKFMQTNIPLNTDADYLPDSPFIPPDNMDNTESVPPAADLQPENRESEGTSPSVEFEIKISDMDNPDESATEIKTSASEEATSPHDIMTIQSRSQTMDQDKKESGSGSDTKPADKTAETYPHEDLFDRSRQRIQKLKELSMASIRPRNPSDLEKIPAFIRRNVTLDETPKSSSEISRFSITEDENKNAGIKPNGFLHDKAD